VQAAAPFADLLYGARRDSRLKLALVLEGAGESVVDVPPKLSARVRVLSSFAGNARKNDELDASRGASRMPSSGASWQTRRPAPLDKEEPRTP
jgi:hypothetical protein